MTTTGGLVLREGRGAVAVLTLNRPSRRNALSRGLVAALGDVLTDLSVDHSVRSVVLTGEGPSFCTGMDLNEAAETGHDAEGERKAIADLRGIADLVRQLHELPKPVVAALNGDAFAGGAGLACACDFIVAAEGARVGFPEVLRGLVPAVVLHDLVRQVGDRRARELLLTGDPIGVDRAESWGLVNRVVPRQSCLAEAVLLASGLAAGGPQALATVKRLLDDAGGRKDLRGSAAVTAAVLVSDEAAEGIRAFFEKRPPSWDSNAGRTP